MAGRALTDSDFMLSLRFKAEGFIKGGYRISLGQGHSGMLADQGHGFRRNIVISGLNFLKKKYQGVRPARVSFDDIIYIHVFFDHLKTSLSIYLNLYKPEGIILALGNARAGPNKLIGCIYLFFFKKGLKSKAF
jgi:hypothetical protein